MARKTRKKNYPSGYNRRTPEELEATLEKVRTLYDPGETLRQFAQRLDEPVGTVCVWVAKLRKEGKIPPPSLMTRKLTQADRAKIVEMLRRGTTGPRIAERFSVHLRTAYEWVRDLRASNPDLPPLTHGGDPVLPSHKELVRGMLRLAEEQGQKLTTAEIAEKIGLSRPQVSVLVWRLRRREKMPYDPAKVSRRKRLPRGKPEPTREARTPADVARIAPWVGEAVEVLRRKLRRPERPERIQRTLQDLQQQGIEPTKRNVARALGVPPGTVSRALKAFRQQHRTRTE